MTTAPPPPGYVSGRALFELDKKLRQRHGLQPRLNYHSFHNLLWRLKIKNSPTGSRFKWWNEEHFYDVFTDMYEKHGNLCSRFTRSSRIKSHLIATPAILANPNWLPRKQACAAAGVNPRRIGIWITCMTILPYYDLADNRLLYPVDQLREKAQWRPLNFIRKHLGKSQAEKIQTTAPKKLIMVDRCLHYWIYRVPELAHL